MEPLDSDFDYMVRPSRPASPASRTKVMLILPILGTLLVLTFVAAAIFQLSLTDLVDSLMGVLTLFFVITVALFFWAFAPRREQF
jgi:uncharacterized RDD family membrane protein YckC